MVPGFPTLCALLPLITKANILFSTDNMPCHFTAAFAAGFCTTIVASPVDVVKTRYMNSVPGQYSNAINCALTMLVKEGPTAFYKGFVVLLSDASTQNIHYVYMDTNIPILTQSHYVSYQSLIALCVQLELSQLFATATHSLQQSGGRGGTWMQRLYLPASICV